MSVNRTRAFRVESGSDRTRAWILKNCWASAGPEAEAKSILSVSDEVFAIAGIKQNIAVCNWCDCGWLKIIFFFIKISAKFKVMFLISGLHRADTG